MDTVPWLYGTQSAPEGNFDKICFTTFKLGGFKETYKTVRVLLDEMAKNVCLMGEFQACRKRLSVVVCLRV
jgi:hypothetical protein